MKMMPTTIVATAALGIGLLGAPPATFARDRTESADARAAAQSADDASRRADAMFKKSVSK